MDKEPSPLLFTLYFVYFEFMLYHSPEIYIGRRFLKYGCYSKHIISAVAKESLISYNLTQRRLETEDLYTVTPNVTKNQIKQI